MTSEQWGPADDQGRAAADKARRYGYDIEEEQQQTIEQRRLISVSSSE